VVAHMMATGGATTGLEPEITERANLLVPNSYH
jgi:hypothetical protein